MNGRTLLSLIAFRCCFFSVDGSTCPLFVGAGLSQKTIAAYQSDIKISDAMLEKTCSMSRLLIWRAVAASQAQAAPEATAQRRASAANH
jgi:hypothetical protein